ncbi:MAG: CDP-archaeol synthase [Syntrophobacteraceae bacterium]
MLLFLKILFLLWLINLAPPLLSHLLEDKWNAPLDGGRLFRDSRPIFGPHKTRRGVIGAILTGILCGALLGFPWWIGLLAAALSVVGDLLSSFIKRRWDTPSGTNIPGLDQGFEGTLPFIALGPYCSLDAWTVIFLIILFSVGAYIGSWFLNEILLVKPFEAYPRRIRSSVRLKELRSCHVTSSPLHYLVNFENAFYYHFFMKSVFRLMGIYEKGKQNALQLRKCDATFYLPDLPPTFEGYTLLFISDLHLDGLPGLTERLLDIVSKISADLCIVGGDLRMETHGPFEASLSQLCRLLPSIRARDGIYAVLGNHDCTRMIEPLQKMGMNFLVNDSVAIERGEERIWIVGVDDPHYYKCHDLELAFDGVPEESLRILVAHSNEIYREASLYSPDLYLCGHTHAGQIQIPLIGPVFTHSRAPRKLCHGIWDHNGMMGYTTRGVGVSGIPVRFSCLGEVTLITLRKGPSSAEVIEEDIG